MAWLDLRLVPLDIDDDLGVQTRRDFGDSIRAAWMILACHGRPAAEGLHGIGNSPIVGRHDDLGDQRCLLDLLINMLDKELPRFPGQWFAWKPG